MINAAANIKPGEVSESYERDQFQALDRAVTRLSFLSEASRRLSYALSDQECFQQLLNLMVPTVADWATLSLVVEPHKIKRIALAHADPEKNKAIESLVGQYPPLIDDPYGAGQVIRTGKSEFDPNVDAHLEEYLKQFRYPEIANLVRDIGIHSLICVPLEAHGQILGALWMATAGSGRRFVQEDLKLAEEVASRAALSAYHLLLYEKANHELEKLEVERNLREAYLAQIRHDALSVLTEANLLAEIISRMNRPGIEPYARRIIASIQRAAAILRSGR